MEWKKITGMEYGKIVFHSIPYHALIISTKLLCFLSSKKGGFNPCNLPEYATGLYVQY